MPVTRVVPNLPVTDVTRSSELLADVFGLRVAMDLGWVANVGPDARPEVQLQVMTIDRSAPCNPTVSIGVDRPDEVDALHDRVVAADLEIVHPVTDEEWGVRRFFFRD